MHHSKSNFRAIREIVGLSQSDFAERMGVAVQSVKRWERPDGPEPPADAWAELEAWHENHLTAVRHAVNAAINAQEATPNAMPAVTLPYWRSQAEYDATGRGPGYFGVINARCRAIAQELGRYGFEVEFIGPEDRGPERFTRWEAAR